MTAERRYASLVRTLVAGAGPVQVGEGRGFGSTGQLKVDRKIFAMLVRDRLVVKLSRARVDALVEAGEGERFDAGKSKPMSEWFVLSPTSRLPWPSLAREAMQFVGTMRPFGPPSQRSGEEKP